MRPHVFLATPCYGGLVTQGYMQSVLALMAAAPAVGLDLTLAMIGQDALITRCRNTLVSHFMAKPEATHILFVDADISFAPDNLFRLLKADKAVVAGIYPLKSFYWDNAFHHRTARGEPLESAGLHYVGQLELDHKLHREGAFATARYAGTGFMLISRDVIERLQAAFPQTAYSETGAYEPDALAATRKAYALFECVIDCETGAYLSEDFTFCRRWQSIGGQVWLDTEASLTHTGPSDFQGRPHQRRGMAA